MVSRNSVEVTCTRVGNGAEAGAASRRGEDERQRGQQGDQQDRGEVGPAGHRRSATRGKLAAFGMTAAASVANHCSRSEV